MAEQFANGAQSTLSAGIGSGDTTLTVASAGAFPNSGNFRILIDQELLEVTGVSGNTFTVSRAAEALGGVQLATAHGANALVTCVITAGALGAIGGGISIGGSVSGGTAGSVLFVGTGPVLAQDNSNLFWDDANNRLGVGTSSPVADLTLYQTAGTTAAHGLRITGNSIGGTSSGSGVFFGLGYNATDNVQFWVGDAAYIGNASSAFLRIISLSGDAYLDCVNGDNSLLKPLSIGTTTTIGSHQPQTSNKLSVYGNLAVGTGYYNQAAPANGLAVQGQAGLGTVSPSAQAHVLLSDAGTNSVANAQIIGHDTSGTAAAGFGAALAFQLQSSTTADQNVAQIAARWNVATHASRTADIPFFVVTNAGALTEVATVDGGGGASPSANNMGLMLWDVSAGTLVRVTRGASDSGGTGFRLLRVPN